MRESDTLDSEAFAENLRKSWASEEGIDESEQNCSLQLFDAL